MKRFVLPFLLLFMGVSLNAQQPEVSQTWLMNERLLDLLNSYERFVSFDQRSDTYAFMALFKSQDAKVYCDYFASPDFGTQVKAADYSKYSQGLSDRTVQISNIRKSAYSLVDGDWRTKLEFDKKVEYEDSLGLVFSTKSPLAGGDFHLTMDCVWDKQSQSFRIVSISGKENEASSFPKGVFNIVQRKNEIDDRMLYGGKKLQFNEYGFAILSPGQQFEVDDDDFSLTINKTPGAGRYELNTFSIVPKRFRVKGHVSLSPFGAYKVTASAGDDITAKSSSFEIGADVGYAVSLSKSSKLVFYTGLGVSFSSIDLKAKDIRYSMTISDAARANVIRAYNLTEASEGIKMTDIVIPAYLSLENNLSPKMTLTVDAGAKVYLASSVSPKAYKIKGTVTVNGVGHDIDNTYDQFVSPNTNTLNQFAIAVFGKIGMDYAFSSGKYVYLKVGYEMGMTDSYAPSTPVQWYDSSGIYPLVYSGTSDVAVHSFMGSVSYKRSGVALELGVRFKFGKKN